MRLVARQARRFGCSATRSARLGDGRVLSLRPWATQLEETHGAGMPATAGAVALAALAAAATATTASFAFSLSSTDEDAASSAAASTASPFVYPELTAGIAQRQKAERALRDYSEQVKVMFHQVRMSCKSEAEYRVEMARLKAKVMARHTEITFGEGINPHAREAYLNQFGCSRWTDQVLGRISEIQRPVVEIGAGAGQWQRALAARGVDIVAYDNVPSHRSSLPGHSGKVLLGGVEKISSHPDRILLLCYPDPSAMAHECLKLYEGDTLLYVGEGRGGVNANAAFFDALEQDWDCQVVEEMDPFPQCFERFYILTRRHPR